VIRGYRPFFAAIRKIAFALPLILCGASVHAQTASPAPDLTGLRPNAGGDPDETIMRLGLLDVAEIDDREQVFGDRERKNCPYSAPTRLAGR
jgi:hypothetical protein